MTRRWLYSADVHLDDTTGALLTRSGFEGNGKPDLLEWNQGSNDYTTPVTGNVTHPATVVFIQVTGGGALVSIGDLPGQEKPYVIPPGYWRELTIPGGIVPTTRIVAKNLHSQSNFIQLIAEVR